MELTQNNLQAPATKIALKIPLLDLCKMFGWSNPRRAMIYYNPTSSEIAARLSQP